MATTKTRTKTKIDVGYIVVSIPCEGEDLEPLCFQETWLLYRTEREAMDECRQLVQDHVDCYNKENGKELKILDLFEKVDNRMNGSKHDLGYDPTELVGVGVRYRVVRIETRIPS